MLVSCSLISTIVLFVGQSQSAPILGLELGSNDGLIGGPTRHVNAVPANDQLNQGLLAGLLLESPSHHVLLGGSSPGQLLTLTGYNGGNSSISNDGLLRNSSLKKRISLPLIGELGSFDGLKTKVQSMASGLGSKLGGLLRKRNRIASLNAAYSGVPFLGYIPGLGALPAFSDLPGIQSVPGLVFIPGLGRSEAPSGIISTLTRRRFTVEPETQGALRS